jgi:cytoskeletal protein CcmA (bactofilin family)
MWKRDETVTPREGHRDLAPEAAAVVSRTTEKAIMDLGKSVVIKGELSASENLTLYGQVERRVTLPDHTLTIGPAANIKASISAKAVVIMGAVTGNVAAGEKVEIRATGSVAGDLTSPRLVVADGGDLRGKVEMQPGSLLPHRKRTSHTTAS